MHIYIMYVYDVYRFLRYRIILFFQRFRGSSNLLIIADPCCFEAQMERRDSKEPTENWASKVMKAPTASWKIKNQWKLEIWRPFLQRGDENYEFKENARDHHVSQQTYLRHTCNSNMFSPYHSINLHLHCPFLQVHQGLWASRAMSEQKVQRVLRQMWPAWQLWAAWNWFCLDCRSFLIVSYTFIVSILDFFPVLLVYFDCFQAHLDCSYVFPSTITNHICQWGYSGFDACGQVRIVKTQKDSKGIIDFEARHAPVINKINLHHTSPGQLNIAGVLCVAITIAARFWTHGDRQLYRDVRSHIHFVRHLELKETEAARRRSWWSWCRKPPPRRLEVIRENMKNM